MLFNSPRNSPRLLFAILLTILSLCFLFQWQQDSSNPKSWKLVPKFGEIKDQIRDPKERFQSFLPRLLEHVPSNESLELPEGYLLIRIEDINEESTRIDHLTLSDDDLNQSSTAHSKVLEILPEYDDLITYQKRSRGIITVGGGTYTPALLVSIRMLRRTKCNLPVEVFVPSPSDYDPYSCDVVLRSLNAKCIILPQFGNKTIARYQYKSVALLFSTFEDTLFLDADNFPVINPTSWFDSEAYKSTGMITWPDFWANTASPVYYRITNQVIPDVKTQHASTEAGSILISRSKHNRTLLLAFYYNLFGPGFYYELLSQNGIGGEGDKETWVAAANALNATYYQVRERNHALLMVEESREEDVNEIISMVQYDFVKDWELSFSPTTNNTEEKEQEQKEGETEVNIEIPKSRNRQDAQIVFLHCNRVKMNPSEVLARLDDFHGRQRMWGTKQKTIDRFGRDIEAEIWEEVIEVACRYGETLLLEEEQRNAVCADLRRFWWKILMEEELEDRIGKAKEEDLKMKEGEKEKEEGKGKGESWLSWLSHEDEVKRSG
ncbi:mannosyltransferase [Ciborinia camelliae]|nr:mannosyltransferase [Ciborinia camelliae]